MVIVKEEKLRHQKCQTYHPHSREFYFKLSAFPPDCLVGLLLVRLGLFSDTFSQPLTHSCVFLSFFDMYFTDSVTYISLNLWNVFLWFFDMPFPRTVWSVCWSGGASLPASSNQPLPVREAVTWSFTFLPLTWFSAVSLSTDFLSFPCHSVNRKVYVKSPLFCKKESESEKASLLA